MIVEEAVFILRVNLLEFIQIKFLGWMSEYCKDEMQHVAKFGNENEVNDEIDKIDLISLNGLDDHDSLLGEEIKRKLANGFL